MRAHGVTAARRRRRRVRCARAGRTWSAGFESEVAGLAAALALAAERARALTWFGAVRRALASESLRAADVLAARFGFHLPLPFGDGPGRGCASDWSAGRSGRGANWFGSGPIGWSLFACRCPRARTTAAVRGLSTTRRRAARSARAIRSGDPFGDGTPGQP
jgi:hypothetical protein